MATLAPLASAPAPIHEIRDHRVILDVDLARVYGVSLRQLHARAKRFPGDFCFPLEPAESFQLGRAEAVAFTDRGVIAVAMALGLVDAAVVSARLARLVAEENPIDAAPQ